VLHEQPQKLLLRLGLILAPALAGVLAWSYAHRDFFHAPQAARSLVVAAPPARPAADVPAVEPALRAATRNAEPRAPAKSARATAAPATTPTPAPAPTALALQGAPPAAAIPADDPKAIRALAQRGLAAYGLAANDEQRAASLRLVQIAALVGDGLARERLAQDFPRSAAVRSAVPVKDAVRYALHDYAAGSASADDRNQPFVALAAFFAGRDELQTFAVAVVEAIAEEPRLQAPASLDALLGSLAHVRGSCRAIAGVVEGARVQAVECPRSLKTSLLAHVRRAGRSGREDDARRRGLQMLQQLGAR
jgi:hypothetical protein